MEEICLKSQGIYHCFLNFNKTFDIMLCEDIWRCIEELEVPCKYIIRRRCKFVSMLSEDDYHHATKGHIFRGDLKVRPFHLTQLTKRHS